MKIKKTMITGVQPTGNFTLGNYVGAIKNFVRLQKDYKILLPVKYSLNKKIN